MSNIPRSILSGLIMLTSGLCQEPLEKFFGDYTGTLVIYDEAQQNYIIVNERRATNRYTPWSTFKIPNSIIALETGVVTDVDEVVKWDGEQYPAEIWWPETWKGDQNLRSGIKYSVVPLFRTMAVRIGEERMQNFISAFDYGNQDISSGIDNFWLNGSLQISTMEQITFLKKFYHGKLGISPRTSEAVRDILVQETTDVYSLSYKTGAGTIDREKNLALGWLVGYVEKEGQVYFFAANIEAQGFAAVLKPRVDIPMAILKELGIIE